MSQLHYKWVIIGNQNLKAKYLWDDRSFELVTWFYSYDRMHHRVLKESRRLEHL